MPRIFNAGRLRNAWESGAWPNVEPEIREALASRVDQELAKRSLPGALVYFVVSVVLALATPYYTQHPAVLAAAGGLTLLSGGVRFLAARRLFKRPAEGAGRAKLVFTCATYATFVVWGAFCGWTLHLYDAGWTAMFLLLNTAALAGGATLSLAPSIRLATRCLLILIGPTIAVAAGMGSDPRYLGLGFVAAIYLVFLLVQARGNGQEFWTASIAAERERIRGSAERRRAEAERASLVAAVEQAAEEILITDADGTLRYCNPSFERLSGYSRSEVIGRNPRLLKSGKHDAVFYGSLWSTIVNGGVWTGRFTNRKKDGTLYEVEGTISPILDAGRITGFVSARHDVTERLRMEHQLQQAQKMESIGRLAGGVAHDFNNLLTVITGYGSVLESLLKEQAPHLEYLQEILRASDQAAGLTRQLLTFSRKQIAVPKAVNLGRVLAETQRMLQRLVGEDVEIVVVGEPLLGLVRMDPGQVSQILMNLAANARDAMPGGGRLTFRTANVEPGRDAAPSENSRLFQGPTVLLSVSDTGMGMNEDTRQHIFEPFFSTKDRGRGTGLGLSMVYGIVEQSGGFIEVESEPGRGTAFHIYLPRMDGHAEMKDAVEAALTGKGGSETVLVVEDADEVRRLVTIALKSAGYRVLAAADGIAALLESGRYPGTIDLLVTDVIMPGMTGKDVAEQLLVSRPAIKVLYVSGYTGDVIAHRGVLDDDVAYLPKPFTPPELVSKVREVLGPGG
jgi:PAS domain S-box-containing protein